MIKKILIFLILCFSVTAVFSPNIESAHAAGRKLGDCTPLLGLVPWDCNFSEPTNQDELSNGIWTIVTNIATDITVIAAYLILGYVIYGGYQYIFSAGDPNKVTSGKNTLAHGFIGLGIVMSANLIMSTIRVALVGSNSLANCVAEECIDANTMISNSIQWVIGVAGIVAVIFVVYGGISYITSSGDPNKVQKARQTIIYALIGIVIVALAEVITAFVSNLIREANDNAFINNTTIAKELNEKNN